MKKYKFSTTEKFVIWNSYSNKCYYCGEPLKFDKTTIDHLFPEHLLNKKLELEKIKLNYSLPTDFKINDFCNWVPAHSSCNGKKSVSIINNSPMFLLAIERIQEKSKVIKKRYNKLKKTVAKDKIIGKLLMDLEKDNITQEDLLSLIESTSIYFYNKPKIHKKQLTHLPNGWKVLSLNERDGVIGVTNGLISGNIPTDITPHASWACGTCHSYGPWDGNKCCNCGHYNSPD